MPNFQNNLAINSQFYPSQNNIEIQNDQNHIYNNISLFYFEPDFTSNESNKKDKKDYKIFRSIMSKEDCEKEYPICSICLDEIKLGEEISKMPCKHLFHINCCKSWFDINPTCPICRFNIAKEEK